MFSKKEQSPRNHWKDINNCRIFFEEFAKGMGFDPMDLQRWYAINLKSMLFKKVSLYLFIFICV